jgi:hypothetical protein
VEPAQKRKAEAEFKRSQERGQTQPAVAPLVSNSDGVLDDKALAGNMLAQAKRMEQEAKSMISEAARMKKDAQRMFPGVQNTGEVIAVPQDTAQAKTRGRKKAVTADAVQ